MVLVPAVLSPLLPWISGRARVSRGSDAADGRSARPPRPRPRRFAAEAAPDTGADRDPAGDPRADRCAGCDACADGEPATYAFTHGESNARACADGESPADALTDRGSRPAGPRAHGRSTTRNGQSSTNRRTFGRPRTTGHDERRAPQSPAPWHAAGRRPDPDGDGYSKPGRIDRSFECAFTAEWTCESEPGPASEQRQPFSPWDVWPFRLERRAPERIPPEHVASEHAQHV